jgi:hypothetical protein
VGSALEGGRRKRSAAEAAALLERLRVDAGVLVRRFDLSLRSLDAELPRVRRRYGVCYSDGSIRIRLRHASTGQPLKYSSLVNTLCHELAHLRHFNHGPRFRAFYERILEFARAEGIYRPGLAFDPDLEPGWETPVEVPHAMRAASVAKRRRGAADRAASKPVQLGLFG